MAKNHVDILDLLHIATFGNDWDGDHFGELAAIVAAEANGCCPNIVCNLDGFKDILGVSGARNSDEDIVLADPCTSLSSKDILKGCVISPREQKRRGVGEGNDFERLAAIEVNVLLEVAYEV